MKEMAYLSLGLNKGIVGRIPPELGNLSKLERLNLANMNLRGPIPTAFGQLENLVDLHLENNRLSRGLPEELENLAKLLQDDGISPVNSLSLSTNDSRLTKFSSSSGNPRLSLLFSRCKSTRFS